MRSQNQSIAGSEPARIALGWLKIRHTSESFRVWNEYRVMCKLCTGAKSVQSSRQHRAFGVAFDWGGCEYWGYQCRDEEAAVELGQWCEYVFTLGLADFCIFKAQGHEIRLPDGATVLTDWSDEALSEMQPSLREYAGLELMDLLGLLVRAGAIVTRIDISADFANTVIEPVVASMEAKDYSPMRVHEFRDSRGKGEGRTCYFGVRGKGGSGVYVRFYEKAKEQHLPGDLLRYEVELTSDKAQDAARKLVAASGGWETVARSILAGAMDFRDGYGKVRGNSNAARDCSQAWWWGLLLNRLQKGVKLRNEKRVDPSLVALEQWMEKNGRPLAMLKAAKGDKRFWWWLGNVIKKGAGRLTERDLRLIRQAQACDVPF